MKVNKLVIGRWSLVAILLLAAFLRLYRLGDYPALNADEAAIGYNAYSLIQTGKDEHGTPWPIHFQSFNDYKPGGYFYIVLPFVYFFGLNEWSVRLPGAILGILTVLVIYLLTKELVKDSKIVKLKISKAWPFRLEEIAAFMLAISPWHIHFSRGGWEVNVSTFFITLGMLLFLKSLKNPNYFALCILSFVMSLYTYHAARVVVPLFGFALLIIYRKDLFNKVNKRQFLGSILLGAVLLIPLITSFASGAGVRASGVGIFADRGYIDRIEEKRARHEEPGSAIYRVLYNKPKELGIEFVKNYFEHFWGQFLFISGDDIERDKVPEFGQLYLWQLPVLLIAAIAVIRRSKGWTSLLIWLAVAPIPAALTFQSPHALRSQSMVVPFTILSAYGLVMLIELLQRNIEKKIILATCCILLSTVLVWDFSRYLHEYYVHMAKTYPYSSQYGVKELVEYINGSEYKDKQIVITTRYDQPYILFLFYGIAAGNNKVDPILFQEHHILTAPDKFGFSTVPYFDNLIFKSINYKDEDRDAFPGLVIVGADEEIPEEVNVVKNIYGSNGYLYFQVVVN